MTNGAAKHSGGLAQGTPLSLAQANLPGAPAGVLGNATSQPFSEALAAFRASNPRGVVEPYFSRTERALWADLRGERRRTDCVAYLEDHDIHLPATRA